MSKKKSRKSKPLIYLVGPMTGCNEEQMRGWRKRVRRHWGKEFEFIDPTEDLVEDKSTDYEIVSRDERDIKRADGVLANMWRESVGTAIGIAVANRHAKPVALSDPNCLRSRIANYYADVTSDTADNAMRGLKQLLKSQKSLGKVLKKGGKSEPFSKAKLAASIRKACRAANKSDILVPPLVVPMVLEKLLRSRSKDLTTTLIKDAVWKVLVEMEGDPQRDPEIDGIRQAWEAYDQKGRTVLIQAVPPQGGVAKRALGVPFGCGKNHHCIWGTAVKSMDKLPAIPRKAFGEICKVPGISEIRLTTSTSARLQSDFRFTALQASKTAGVLEGKAFDPKAKRGNLQCFQIRVHDHGDTESIRVQLVDHLGAQGLLEVSVA